MCQCVCAAVCVFVDQIDTGTDLNINIRRQLFKRYLDKLLQQFIDIFVVLKGGTVKSTVAASEFSHNTTLLGMEELAENIFCFLQL